MALQLTNGAIPDAIGQSSHAIFSNDLGMQQPPAAANISHALFPQLFLPN